MGEIVSELLTEALGHRMTPTGARRSEWISKPMRALVDLADKEALYGTLDQNGT